MNNPMKTGVLIGRDRWVKCLVLVLGTGFFLFLPGLGFAQSFSESMIDFQKTLDEVGESLGPGTAQLRNAARAIAGIGAVFYIGNRVWKQIAAAESIDFYPLFRPFVLTILILNFSWVIGFIEALMNPVLLATYSMQEDSNTAIERLIAAKQEALENGEFYEMYVGEAGQGDRELWYEYSNPEAGEEGWMESVGNGIQFALEKASFHMQLNIKTWISEVLQVLYLSASLAIKAIRTFYLVILSILGPISFGLAVFDGFQHTLTQWVARYINVFLWLPVANIFGVVIGKIQEGLLEVDLAQIENTGKTFFSSTDTAYLIFMVIAILGYMTVPSVSNYIIYAGGNDSLLHKSSNVVSGGAGMAGKLITGK